MRPIFYLLFITIVFLIGYIAWDLYRISQQPNVTVVGGVAYDAGEVSSKRPIVHIFKIVNPHSFAVGILTPMAGCTCTTATTSVDIIPPNGTAQITLIVDPEDKNISGSASIVTTYGRKAVETWLFVTGKTESGKAPHYNDTSMKS